MTTTVIICDTCNSSHNVMNIEGRVIKSATGEVVAETSDICFDCLQHKMRIFNKPNINIVCPTIQHTVTPLTAPILYPRQDFIYPTVTCTLDRTKSIKDITAKLWEDFEVGPHFKGLVKFDSADTK